MLIAQISDCHVRRPGDIAFGRVDTAACLERCVACVNAVSPRPDIAVITGDLVDSADPEEYRNLRRLLDRLVMPYYLIPGNHDGREGMREVFPDHSYLFERDEWIQYEIPGFALRVLMLDTLVPGEESGMMDAPRLAWLEARLANAPQQPTMIFMHHPPFDTGVADMDRIKCQGTDDLARLLARHPQVLKISCGHVHRTIQAMWAGKPVSVAPSSAHQIALDLDTKSAPAQYVLEPSGFLLHLWREETGVVTHYCVADRYPGPYPFQ